MKKLILAITFFGAVATVFLYSNKSWCFGRECPVGKKCYSNYDCETFRCNLSCEKVDKIGFDKRCLIN